ncbi:hypothetical protein AAIH32_02740 [Pseudarthrobacter oxydans]|uniref:hypothetical protein n=1 Tax=Pseudarthrobacter oxydans TaxID=1671 RepID=UPI003D2A2AB2
MNSLLQSAAWKGTDGDRFRREWSSTLRPMLNKASESLRSQSTSLLKHADEQEQASGAGADAGSAVSGHLALLHSEPGQPAQAGTPERRWDDAFTDPNYEHAPAGLEWLLEKWIDDGSGAADITSALQFVADKFSWNIDLANVQEGTSRFFDGMKWVGKGLTVLGGFMGALDIMSGLQNKDPFRLADGVVGGGLAVAAGLAAATGVGLPVAAAIGGAGLLWGLASMASDDVPVTKRIWDFGAGVVGGVTDLATGMASGIRDTADGARASLGWVGGRLGFG